MALPSITEKILIRIEVHVDTLCPWCYIEKRSLDAAMRQFQDRHPEVEFEVLWRPFYLYPMLDAGEYFHVVSPDTLAQMLASVRSKPRS